MTSGREIFAIGISHDKCDASIIAEYSLLGSLLDKVCLDTLNTDGIDEIFTLSTCNRVEIFLVGSPEKTLEASLNAVTLNGMRPSQFFLENAKIYRGKDAIIHIFETASGLKSQMIGETEILGQIKKAYADSSEKNYCKAVLNRVIQKAIQCAKWVRTNTEIGSGNTTIGAVAAEVASRIFEDATKTRILLAGSGEVGRSVAQALHARGAENITVSSRTWENAKALSDDVKGSAIGFERVAEELGKFDIAIFAMSNAEHFIDLKIARAAEIFRKQKPIFLMDLGVPNNVEKSCANLDGVFLYDLSDLSKVANENIKMRENEIEKAQIAISEKAQYLFDKLNKTQM